MTPRQFQALTEAYEDFNLFEKYKAGLVPSMLHGMFKKKSDPDMPPIAFFEPKKASPKAQATFILMNIQKYNSAYKRAKSCSSS